MAQHIPKRRNQMDSNTQPAKEQKFVMNGTALFVLEDSKKYRIPYHIIKRAVFSNLKKADLIDVPHSARLQYKLMLMGAVIKAIVDFDELKITVMYNPTGADNGMPKTSMEQLTNFLAQEGIPANAGSTKNEDCDYLEFYSYAYSSPSIRKSAPYSYTLEEWEKLESAYIKKRTKEDREKFAKFREWQDIYAKEKGVADVQSAKARSISNIFGLKK